jgi:hypothetical protein
MSWIRAFLELNKSLFLKGLLLLMAFLLGLQMGQSRLQRQWDAEKQTVQIAQAKQEQHVDDVVRVQNQISKEISDDYRKKSSLLVNSDFVLGSKRVLDKSETSSSRLSAVPSASQGVEGNSSDMVFVTSRDGVDVSCFQLIKDSEQTTLMLYEIQRWNERITSSK